MKQRDVASVRGSLATHYLSSPSTLSLAAGTSKWVRCSLLGLLLFAIVLSSSPGAMAQTTIANTPPSVTNGTATLVGHYNPANMLRLAIGLQPPHLAEEQQFLESLQHVAKGQPPQFLTAAQWSARFDPTVEQEQAVVDWATSQGLTVTRRFPNRLIVDVQGTSGAIEKALNVTINSYQVGARTAFSNDRDPSIPANLVGIIHSIGGLNTIEVMRPNNKLVAEPAFPDYSPGPAYSAGASQHGDGDISKLPQSLKASGGPIANYTTGAPYDPQDMYSTAAYDSYALYNLGHCCNPTGISGGSGPNTSIAIASFGEQQTSDMVGFHTQYPYLAYDFNEYYIDGTPACCDGEGTMDLEWSTAMSNSFGSYQDTAHVYMYDGVSFSFGTAVDVYNAMLTDGYARNFSTSWGCEEGWGPGAGLSGDQGCYDQTDADTANNVFASMVGQGWSLTAASGDQGASAGCDFWGPPHTAVQFPSSSPYIVAAGGTTLNLAGGPPPSFSSVTAWTGGPDGCDTNDGGSTGGYSIFFGEPSYQSGLPSRGVPDIALNADWYNTPQYFYFEGSLSGNGGTSIVAPETVGFFAQANSYLLWLGYGPIGNPNPYFYGIGYGDIRPPHYPFYDITTGCNNNDITLDYGLTYYCAGAGWDAVTGWGMYNFLQLAWALNWSIIPPINYPTPTFSGPAVNTWYNSNQEVSWTVTSSNDGAAGQSVDWDVDPGNPTSEATPGLSGFPGSPYNAFYDGPQFINNTGSPTGSFNGCWQFFSTVCSGGPVGQGLHTLYVRTWGNEGESEVFTYGPLGYDTIPPVTTDTLGGTLSGSTYITAVTNTLTATDPGAPTTGSGVASTVYQINSGTVTSYSAPFTVSTVGPNTVTFHSTDHAGNVESTESVSFSITSPTATTLSSSLNPAGSGKSVTFTAITAATVAGNTPTGTVTFKDGATVLATKTLSGGKATFATSTLALGSHSITATYSGATYFSGSASSALTETILNDTTTTLASSKNPSTFGGSVTLTATVTHSGAGTPTGTVTFKQGSTTLGSSALSSSGKATFSTSALKVGTDSITAVYSGDSNFETSTSTALKQVVDKANSSTSVASSLNPSVSGQTVTFTATVTSSGGTPTGSVTFKDGTTVLGSKALSGGIAAFSTSKLATGTHSITADYGGSSDFNTSDSSTLEQVVNP
jgi:hypothetical protein